MINNVSHFTFIVESSYSFSELVLSKFLLRGTMPSYLLARLLDSGQQASSFFFRPMCIIIVTFYCRIVLFIQCIGLVKVPSSEVSQCASSLLLFIVESSYSFTQWRATGKLLLLSSVCIITLSLIAGNKLLLLSSGCIIILPRCKFLQIKRACINISREGFR